MNLYVKKSLALVCAASPIVACITLILVDWR